MNKHFDADDFNDIAVRCHRIAREHGFWDEPRNKGEMIALIHSELSELLEAVRKPGPDHHCPGFDNEAIELADAVIRIMDYAVGFGLPIHAAVLAKLNFNETRPHKHGKRF